MTAGCIIIGFTLLVASIAGTAAILNTCYDNEPNDAKKIKVYAFFTIPTIFIAIAFWTFAAIYDDPYEFYAKWKYDNIKAFDIPEDKLEDFGIDLKTAPIIYSKTYYICSRAHDHMNERCTKDKLCYKLLISNIPKKQTPKSYEQLAKENEL